jgi:hypothetical protein
MSYLCASVPTYQSPPRTQNRLVNESATAAFVYVESVREEKPENGELNGGSFDSGHEAQYGRSKLAWTLTNSGGEVGVLAKYGQNARRGVDYPNLTGGKTHPIRLGGR